MKKKYLVAAAITMFLTTGCTVKYTTIDLHQEGDGEIKLEGLKVTTETDQKADGQLDSEVDTSAI